MLHEDHLKEHMAVECYTETWGPFCDNYFEYYVHQTNKRQQLINRQYKIFVFLSCFGDKNETE